MSNNPINPILVLALVAGFVLAAIFSLFRDDRPEKAEELVKRESKVVVSTRGEDYQAPEDPWGVKLEWEFIPDQKVHKGIVTSAGPDGEFGTEDDISHTATDINKTGIVAEWAGSKVKESVKGFWRGLRNPSEHQPKE